MTPTSARKSVHSGRNGELRDSGQEQHQHDENMPGGQRPRGSGSHVAVGQGRDQENNSGNDGHVVQQIEGAAYDGTAMWRVGKVREQRRQGLRRKARK